MRKIKAVEDPSEYCLVEHVELEQVFQEDESLNLTASATTALNLTNSSSSSNNSKKKLTVKTRILAPSENLFLMTHVWNQMKAEQKDGFKFVKVILTRKNSITRLHNLSLPRQSSLAKPRISISSQPKTTTTTTTLTTSVHANGHKALAVNQKRTKSSQNRLVRQKSFDESCEYLNTHNPNHGKSDQSDEAFRTTVTTTTTTTNDILMSDDEKDKSLEAKSEITEVVESTMALSTEIVLSKNENEEDDDLNEEDRDDYRLINANAARKKSVYINESLNEDDDDEPSLFYDMNNIHKSLTNLNLRKQKPERQSTIKRLFNNLKFNS